MTTMTHHTAGRPIFPGSPWGFDEEGRIVYLPLWDPAPLRAETRDVLYGLAIQDLAAKLSRPEMRDAIQKYAHEVIHSAAIQQVERKR
jgi:hypothetical protein